MSIKFKYQLILKLLLILLFSCKHHVESNISSSVKFDIFGINNTLESQDVQEKRNYVIYDNETFQNRFSYSVNNDINFAEEILIISELGTQPTNGYSINIQNIEISSKNTMTVFIEIIKPGERCVVSQVMTTPLIAVKLKKTNSNITFIENITINNCLD